MWALNRRPFKNADVLHKLEKWRLANEWISQMWLIQPHLYYFNVKNVEKNSTGITLPTSLCLEGLQESCIPFTALSPEKRQSIVRQSPFPNIPHKVPLLYDDGATDKTAAWRRATLDEFLSSSVYGRKLDYHLCRKELRQEHLEMPSELTLYNAQQCSNPFIVDSTLEHMDYLTKGPLPESVGSGLTTVASQFNYTSLYWKEVKAADQSAGPTAAPHCIMTLEGIDLVHVSQLSVEQQKKLLTTISRHVLMGSLKTPFIYCHRRWLLSKKVALTEPVGRDDIPLADARDQPLLWVDTSLVESYEGAPIQRYRQVKRFYYNSSQLTPFQSTDELEQKAELTSDSPE